jgi:small-conductance mechanosensitive channel
MPANSPSIGDLPLWLAQFRQPSVWTELGALAICFLLAWAITGLVRRALHGNFEQEQSVLLGKRLIDGALFPLIWLLLAYIARSILLNYQSLVVFRVAIPLLLSLLAIRVGVKVLQAAFKQAPWVRLLERSISWIIWLAMVLWVTGLLPLVLAELDKISWTLGGSVMSLRTLLEGLITASAVLILSLWVSSALERRLLRKAVGGELSLRKAISNATRALLMFIGVMLALKSVGIDLTALSVLGGAIGVGVGFGLQKLAANYVSGFVILAERSMRIGDVVRVDNFEGRISQINARYTVIRALTGRESIVPNELLLTQRVENLSLADNKLWQSTVVSVGYDSDVEQVIALMHGAALAQERVLKDPEPNAALSAFGSDGLEFTLGYWIADPENGLLNLRSLINRQILAAFREHHITLPYPQRVIHHMGNSAEKAPK